MELVVQPDMDVVDPNEFHLFKGCCLEAQRSDVVAVQLDMLRVAMREPTNDGLVLTVIDEIRATGRYLRELADLSQVHRDRSLVVLNYLDIILPSLQRSLRDIQTYYEDRSMSKKNRWRNMYHQMLEEDDGSPLPQRFSVFNYFLTSLRDILIKSPHFDFNGLDNARIKIMQLRDNQDLPPPPAPVGPRIPASSLFFESDPDVHWAQQIFSLPLPSRTAIKHQYRSTAAGPHQLWGQIQVPDDSRILFRRPFNDDKICLIAYESGLDGRPWLLVRIINPETGQAFFSQRGVQELVIDRDGCMLSFHRWSRKLGRATPWAELNFLTWEELTLMHCCFLVLKARDDRTTAMNPREYTSNGERKLFQARISDDGFWHSLIVYKDLSTGGIRLLAAVWDGELQKCPIWTAFVTHQQASPTWIKRVSHRKIRLADIQLYVFCQEYRQQRQRRGQAGVFELNFHTREACDAFVAVFPVASKRPRTPQPVALR